MKIGIKDIMNDPYKNIAKHIWLNIRPHTEEYSEGNVSDALDTLNEIGYVGIHPTQVFKDENDGRYEMFFVMGTESALAGLTHTFHVVCKREATEEANLEEFK